MNPLYLHENALYDVAKYLQPTERAQLSAISTKAQSPSSRRAVERAGKTQLKALSEGHAMAPNPNRVYHDLTRQLIETIKSYPPEQIPPEIKVIIQQTPTTKEMLALKEFVKARDTLVVWAKIARDLSIDLDLDDAFQSKSSMLEKAKDFKEWLAKHDDQILILNLDNLQLSTFPLEICSLTRVEALWMGNNLIGEIPPEIGNLTTLFYLDISGSKDKKSPLNRIPPEIGKLAHLETLDINHAHLTQLPNEVQNLTELTHLSVENNSLTELSVGGFLNLIGLWASHNKLTQLDPRIVHLTNLEHLYLNDNRLQHLPYALGNLTNIQESDFSHNHLSMIDLSNKRLTWVQEAEESLMSQTVPEIGNLNHLQPYFPVFSFNDDDLTDSSSEIEENDLFQDSASDTQPSSDEMTDTSSDTDQIEYSSRDLAPTNPRKRGLEEPQLRNSKRNKI